jgi:hypothetical protein
MVGHEPESVTGKKQEDSDPDPQKGGSETLLEGTGKIKLITGIYKYETAHMLTNKCHAN